MKQKLSFKRYFITGLITILPLWVTILVIMVLFNWVSGFTANLLMPFLYIFFKVKDAGILVRIVSFILTIVIIWTTGVVATHIVGRRFLLNIESFLLKIPFSSKIYSALRKFLQYFTQKKSFKTVVLIPFLNQGMYSLGFVTKESPEEFNRKLSKDMVSVFLPTAPNPTTGFLIYVPKGSIIPLDMEVDEAFKFILSGGIIFPEQTVDNLNTVLNHEENIQG